MKSFEKKLSQEESAALMILLKNRFEKNTHRHKNIKWDAVQAKLEQKPEKIKSLYYMEQSGGEPDLVDFNNSLNELYFIDCSKETPKERRSICYDRAALDARKEHKPQNSAADLATEMGIEMLTEEQYRTLQIIEPFDLKTSSWIKTPDAIRKLVGALFCDRRYDTVFVYHNGAESYYAARGFRGILKV